jgi:hypothetical protein
MVMGMDYPIGKYVCRHAPACKLEILSFKLFIVTIGQITPNALNKFLVYWIQAAHLGGNLRGGGRVGNFCDACVTVKYCELSHHCHKNYLQSGR